MRVALSQLEETPLTAIDRPSLSYRYVFSRSAEAQRYGETGQDYVSLATSTDHVSFAVCDGVGQSFFGEVAARQVGEALIDWLDNLTWPTPIDLAESLTRALHDAARASASCIDSVVLPDHLSPVLRQVLEAKRQHGSESVFVAARVDAPSLTLPAGRLTMAWMGDCRLRVFGTDDEIHIVDSRLLDVGHRWSTRYGCVKGGPNVIHLPLIDESRRIAGVMAYSDGLHALDALAIVTNDRLLALMHEAHEQPTSDDISYVEVWIEGRAPWRRES